MNLEYHKLIARCEDGDYTYFADGWRSKWVKRTANELYNDLNVFCRYIPTIFSKKWIYLMTADDWNKDNSHAEIIEWYEKGPCNMSFNEVWK